jgi:hypothetical protein
VDNTDHMTDDALQEESGKMILFFFFLWYWGLNSGPKP